MQNKSYKTNGASDHSQTIVQCPQCQTKFAVDGSVLAEVTSPRFHCSRCDFVFALEAKPAPSAIAAPPTSGFTISEQRGIAQEQSTQPRATANAAPAWSMGSPALDRSNNARGIEIPRNSPPAASMSAPHESHRDNFDFTQMKLDFKKEPEFDNSYSVSSFAQPEPYAIPDPKMEPRTAPKEALPAFDYQRPSTRWSAFTYVAAPLVFFLSILVGLSFYLRHNNEQAENLFASLTKSTAQVAPTELSISSPKFKRVPLDSGESAYLVSGSITNNSQQTFRDLKLEAIGFDESGELVARTKVDAGATLAKTRVRSLTSDMIKNLQSGQLKNKVELKPGESEDFTIALLEGDPSRARFFSARIYSVTY